MKTEIGQLDVCETTSRDPVCSYNRVDMYQDNRARGIDYQTLPLRLERGLQIGLNFLCTPRTSSASRARRESSDEPAS